jgi:uncharacterized protein
MSQNRLHQEKSLYLRQHAHNPVHWWPWGEEAFAEAHRLDKPIFLSIGYSACHWCHVMERESFESEAIASLINTHFIAIKVDREERPDVDDIYMTAVQMMTGQGGWPLSVFLTPEGKPFYGGTYFPPENKYGRLGFGTLVTQLSEAYTNRRAEILEVSENVCAEMEKISRQRPVQAATPITVSTLLAQAEAEAIRHFDAENGGFGGAPKFPPHHTLRLLGSGKEVTKTLDAMALGGIYDHIGGGFHRYSTDAHWLLPHFEKMLYDNAMLAKLYAEAFIFTENPAYARIARETCDWVLRDMQDKDGGFYAAIDADSEGIEGKFYVWEEAEVKEIAGEAFCDLYNIHPNGNFHDESTGRPSGKNIPHLQTPTLPATLPEEMQTAREKLLIQRNKRVAPNRDEKIITAWNGLMIGALARAGQLLDEPNYIDAATRAADFCLTTLSPNGVLQRRAIAGEVGIRAFLDDHVYLADGLLDLHEATLLDLHETTEEGRFLEAARTQMETVIAHFSDVEAGGFYSTSDQHERLITRPKDIFDGALPAANGVAVQVLARLGMMDEARAMIRLYSGVLARAPYGMASFLTALPFLFSADSVLGGDDAHHIHLMAPAPMTLSAGTMHTLHFPLTIAPDWHFNAPPKVTFTSDLPAQIGPTTVTSEKVSVPIHLTKDAPSGAYHLNIVLHVQVCGDSHCLPEETLEAGVSITVR